MESSGPVPEASSPFGVLVVIGETQLARSVCSTLRAQHIEVVHLLHPADDELRATAARGLLGVAVLLHDDIDALRYALAVAHLAPHTPLIVTIFDRTVAEELTRLLPRCQVNSPADLAAPTLAAACLGGAAATAGNAAVTPARRYSRLRAVLGRAAGQLRPHDAGSRLLVLGALGMLGVLAADFGWLVGHGLAPEQALFDATRVLAGVGPAEAPVGDHLYPLLASAAMLATVAFTALFTAGVVERMLNLKLIGLIGPRTLPHSGHVIVVGMGQVGMRLCMELRRRGIRVAGVERDPDTSTARLARALGIPVMTGHGGDRAVLERLHLSRALALAAVGSDDLDNIAVAIAAHGVAPDTRVVIRAGEHEALAETRSLLPMGIVRDVNSLACAYIVERLLGGPVCAVDVNDSGIYLSAPGYPDRLAHSVRHDLCPELTRLDAARPKA